MKSTTSFSVVVTSYNYKNYVVQAIDSVLAQTRAPLEVVVVDDGSTDGSAQVLRDRYGQDKRVVLLCVENAGQLAAFHKGVAESRGDVIAFLDSDDRWQPGYLEKLGDVYDTRPDVDFIFSDIHFFGSDDRVIGYADRPVDCGYTVISTFVLAKGYGERTSALSMRSQCARKILDLPAEMYPQWRTCADMCLVFGASILAARKYFLPTDCVYYRVHDSNASWEQYGDTWGKFNADKDFFIRLNSHVLIDLYAKRMGLSDRCLEEVKYEFKTKPNPSWRETKRYAGLAMRRRGPLLKNLERALSILKRWWKLRHEAPVESKTSF